MSAATRRAALGAILAAPLTGGAVMARPSVSVPAAPPTDLANACDWAVAHVAWVNTNEEPVDAWPDDRLEAELARVDDVLHRVADEPAAGLSDLAAKARILRCDWEAALGGRRELHPGERALLTFLKEVSTCA